MFSSHTLFVVAQVARDGMQPTVAHGGAAVVGTQDPDPDWQPI